ncbi:hypothetical protein [Mesorhizobium sp. WSM3859]|uniref:hypothetical protein n=1 Tax=Mesorhizobium sp. WSM3859 TaxID=2029402 RepID=UPI001140FA56|nr:hypothetical protein [Mesorhizobium sp. WSM3859]
MIPLDFAILLKLKFGGDAVAKVLKGSGQLTNHVPHRERNEPKMPTWRWFRSSAFAVYGPANIRQKVLAVSWTVMRQPPWSPGDVAAWLETEAVAQ